MRGKGFSLIEIMVAVALAAIFIPAIGMVLSFALKTSVQGENYSRSWSLGQEGMEAIFHLKEDWDWVGDPANTAPGEYYQPERSGGAWVLGEKTTSPGPVDDFTRKVEIYQVRRCGTEVCSESWAQVDDFSRRIVVYVTWAEAGQESEVKLESLVVSH